MKSRSGFWEKGKASWTVVIVFAIAAILYSVCCYPLYTASKIRVMRQLYEDIQDMDLEDFSEEDEETLNDYQ